MKKRFASLVHEVRVAVLGDFILDEYVWGETNRISPEAPVPIVRMVGSELRLGGAANVVNNLHALGAQVVPISATGSTQGWKLVKILEDMGIDVNQIVRAEEYKNAHKIRIVSGSQQLLRLDNEKETVISEQTEQAIIENLEYVLEMSDVLVISDYRKGICTPKICAKAIQVAQERRIPIVVDPKGKDYSLYKGASVITPNESELEAATSIKVMSENAETVQIAAMVLIKKLGLQALILTRAENGMTVYWNDGTYKNISSHALEVFDVTGAGDTVVAALAAALGTGFGYEHAAVLASEAAAVVVSKVGTATCSLKELVAEVPKVKDLEELKVEIEVEKSKGKRIVFTNGCFDLLHSGHVKLLQKASTYGDILVVGLNSDLSVRELKGPERPMIEQTERAHILAALNCVDYVTIFNEATPYEVITEIMPDVIVKGKDYENQEVVGQKEIEAVGGRVVLVDLMDGRSTTKLIKKIADSTNGQSDIS